MFYKFPSEDIPLLDALDRLRSIHDHCASWGVSVIGIGATAEEMWVETDKEIPQKEYDKRALHFGFAPEKTEEKPIDDSQGRK